MLDAILIVIFAAVLLFAARALLGFLVQALVSLFSALIGLAGTVVIAGIIILLLVQFTQ